MESHHELDWCAFARTAPQATLFHTLNWRDAVRDTFGHASVYLVARRGGAVRGVLPLFLVKSLIAGRILVSVPYGVGGGVMADDPAVAAELLESAVALAAEHRCRWIDFRSERAAVPGLPVVSDYVGFRRELPDRVEDVLPWLPRKARAAARNGRDKFGLTVSYGPEHLCDVWRLYSINMRRLGSLCFPFRFFRALHEAMPDRTWVSLVRRGEEPVAGLVTFLFKDTVLPYFYGAAPVAQRYSAANFIYFSLAERAVEHGHRVFDFGRSRRDNQGSFDFKRFHGFEPRPLEYQRCLLRGSAVPNLSPSNPAFSLARRLWRRLPLGLTRFAGARLSMHIPG